MSRRKNRSLLTVVGSNGKVDQIEVTEEEYAKAIKTFRRIEGGSDRAWHRGTDANGNAFLLGLSVDTLAMFLDTERAAVEEELVDLTIGHKAGGNVAIRIKKRFLKEAFMDLEEPRSACIITSWPLSGLDANGNPFRVMAGIQITSVKAVPIEGRSEILARR